MQTKLPFAIFQQRITRTYVVLAIALIALVAGTLSTVSFVLYAKGYNDSLDSMVSHVQTRVAFYRSLKQSIQQFGPEIARDESTPRVKISVFGPQHKLIAGDDSDPGSVTIATAALLDMRPRHLHYSDGSIFIQPDFVGFAGYMKRFWITIGIVGAVSVLIAWWAGRAITARAVRPLSDVTDALKAIANGDFTPKLLLESNSGLLELTQAYNDVAQRLNLATLDRRRSESEMRQFIADAGHELRTPLTIFMGYLDALRSGVVQDSSSVSRVHDTMLDESRKMRNIIEKLILLARMERHDAPLLEAVSLDSVASRAVDALRPLAGDRITFTHDGGATITGDDAELYEAVKNVVENAVRYAPDSPVAVRVARNGASGMIEIADNGPGMQTIDVEHAFDRFYRGSGHGEIEGSGLGLAIAKRAVERMGGSIALESHANSGTKVTMEFPLTAV